MQRTKSDWKFASSLLTFLLAAPALVAQEEGEFPNPKHEEHEALKTLAGDWAFTMKMEAMPGVPGMEKPTECKGTERAELICGGLWLKSTMNATWQGKPWQGVWLCGYDPTTEKYQGIMVSSEDSEAGVHTMDGTYDEETRTWTWSGMTPMGEMRSTMTMPDADTTVESCYMNGEGGESTKFMEITRKRAKNPVAVDASASKPTGLGQEQQRLLEDVGTWKATIRCSMNGQELPPSDGSETVLPICHGRWTWSNFQGEMGGMPMEGHALVGYDPNTKEYVGLWFDSMSATCAKTTGTYDAESKTYSMTGSCKDPQGRTMQIQEKLIQKSKNERVLRMQFECEGENSSMEINYERQAKN